MFHFTNIFYLDIFAILLTKLIHKMKKIMILFGMVVFAFTLAVTSCTCGGCDDECTKECCDKSACADNCQKACCLGCKATEGEKKCITLEDGTMPCCVKKSCSDDCIKDCCAKKSCADDCTKDCCAKKSCADNCTKDCCVMHM